MSEFRTIIADPPWRYTQNPTERTGGGVSAEHQYPTMKTEELAALPISQLATADAHCYIWVTNPVLLGMRPTIMGRMSAPDVVRAWGFEPKALITWVKTTKKGELNRGGMGWYFRGATEHIIFGVKGNLPVPPEDRLPNVLFSPRSSHSSKPDDLAELAERVSPGPYVELFARRRRDGWSAWGNEAPESIELPSSNINMAAFR